MSRAVTFPHSLLDWGNCWDEASLGTPGTPTVEVLVPENIMFNMALSLLALIPQL